MTQFEGTVHRGGEAWRQVCEAADLVPSEVRKQREMKAGVPAPGIMLHAFVGLTSSIKSFWQLNH